MTRANATDKQANEFRGLGMRAHVWRVDEEGRRQVLLDEDREEVAPPRSLASGVTQRARGSNPGRTVMCLHPCGARRLLLQRSASTVEGIVDPLAEQRQSSARGACCCIGTTHKVTLHCGR